MSNPVSDAAAASIARGSARFRRAGIGGEEAGVIDFAQRRTRSTIAPPEVEEHLGRFSRWASRRFFPGVLVRRPELLYVGGRTYVLAPDGRTMDLRVPQWMPFRGSADPSQDPSWIVHALAESTGAVWREGDRFATILDHDVDHVLRAHVAVTGELLDEVGLSAPLPRRGRTKPPVWTLTTMTLSDYDLPVDIPDPTTSVSLRHEDRPVADRLGLDHSW